MAELKPVIDARLKEGAEKIAQVVEDEVMSSLGRCLALAIRRQTLLEVIRARAVFQGHQWAPGGNTGYVVTSKKALGKDAVIDTHEVDIPLPREIRETEKQIAIELKQWSEKTDTTHRFESMKDLLERGTPEQLQAGLAELKEWRQKQSGRVN